MLDLDRIQAYCDAATEGPWARYGMGGVTSEEWDIAWEGHENCQGCGAELTQVPFVNGYDADFTAAARTDLPALIAELREARELLKEAGDTLERLRGDATTRLAVAESARPSNMRAGQVRELRWWIDRLAKLEAHDAE